MRTRVRRPASHERSGAAPPVDVDPVSQPFFDAACDGRLLVQRCLQCGTTQVGSEICNHCFGTQLEWVAASGKGVIHSFVVMHLAYHAALKPPYCSAIVELQEGPRIPVLLLDRTEVKTGQAVALAFAPTENGTMVPVARCV